MKIYSLGKRKEDILLLMKYAVPADYGEEARAVVDKYEDDVVALNLLHEFYSFLPEAEDDAIIALRQVGHSEGVFLLCAATAATDYFYVASAERAEFLGPVVEGIWEKEVLRHFGFASREELRKKTSDPDLLPEYIPLDQRDDLCLVCAVAPGEYHVLGCPVETCPWCGGQLTHCNCRFEQLLVAAIDRENEIEMLREKISGKGRIPFDPGRERPAYPVSTQK